MVLHVLDFLTDKFLWPITQQIANAGAGKAVALVQINHQDQVREALQQFLTELFLLPDPHLHGPLLGDVGERALVADDGSIGVPDGARGVEAYRGCPVQPA